MIYIAERYYFNQEKFPYQQALYVTAEFLSECCDGFESKLLTPLHHSKPSRKRGLLPVDATERKQYVHKLLNWIFNNSVSYPTFSLVFYSNFSGEQEIVFDFHNDAYCWTLHLTSGEFQNLSKHLAANNLPEDLFYPENDSACLPVAPGRLGKFMNSLGFNFQSSRCMTPKELEEENKKDHTK